MARDLSEEAVRARTFARNYVAFKEALLREGVEVGEAADEARMAAVALLCQEDERGSGDACPLCGGRR